MDFILLWFLPGLFFVLALIGTYQTCFRSGSAAISGQRWLAVFFYGTLAWALVAVSILGYRLWSSP